MGNLIFENIDWWDDLDDSQLMEISLGIIDVQNGNVTTSKEVWTRYNRN